MNTMNREQRRSQHDEREDWWVYPDEDQLENEVVTLDRELVLLRLAFRIEDCRNNKKQEQSHDRES